jgi:protein SCO1/2
MKRGLFLVLFLNSVLLLAAVGCGQPAEADVQPVFKDAKPEQLIGAVVEPPRPLADFTLPSTDGEFTLSEQRGKLLLFYFGYMTCPDVCPATGAELKRVYEALNQPDKLGVVFITVDPERDTLERLGPYIRLFNPDFVALRGEEAALQGVMEQFGAQAARRQVGESALSYLMDHTATVFLVDEEGRLVEQFLFGTPYTDILHDVRVLLE